MAVDAEVKDSKGTGVDDAQFCEWIVAARGDALDSGVLAGRLVLATTVALPIAVEQSCVGHRLVALQRHTGV